MTPLLDLARSHRDGARCGIYSVCSAHPLVLRAALEHARDCGDYALIEATSNQVNQEGGYTGLRPAEFRARVLEIAQACGLDHQRVLLGGDHLGPNPWQSLPSEEALDRAGCMVDEYVSAGYRKIHLDCSMPCAGDPVALTDAIVAERSARLCLQAEAAWQRCTGVPPVYVIGTEVPTPGGAREALGELAVTAPEAAASTVEAHRKAFLAEGLAGAWERVIALVVQPGVEFDHDHVIAYRPDRAKRLSASLEQLPNLVFEAHSTDYQSEAALTALVRDHFAILKVGPAATFAMREAIWALDQIEQEWHGDARAARVRETALAAMHREPRYWRAYYQDEGRALDLHLQYSLSDRIRYYWTDPDVVAALDRLREALLDGTPPMGLLSQYLSRDYDVVRLDTVPLRMNDIIVNHVRRVLAQYSRACDPKKYDLNGGAQ
ncbi:MAG: D-tagatose-bisphosphate aldolase, class II, non-catalytic subunit [Steroidobacteraceae bacterium]